MNNKQLKNIVQGNIILSQHPDSHLNPNWVLIDSESTDNLFCNPDLITNIQSTTDSEILQMYSSGDYLDNT